MKNKKQGEEKDIGREYSPTNQDPKNGIYRIH